MTLKYQLAEVGQQLVRASTELVENEEEWPLASLKYLQLQQKKAAIRHTLARLSCADFTQELAKAKAAALLTTAELERTTAAHHTLNQQIALYTQRQQDTQDAIHLAQATLVPTALYQDVDNHQPASTAVISDSPSAAPTPLAPPATVEIPWADVQFDDGALLISYGGFWLPRFRFPESRRSLNLIKQHYTFRQAPPLQVRLQQRTVLEVLNREVVLYYIHFLSNTGPLLDVPTDACAVTVGQRFARCTKQYYRTHLPNLFRKQSLRVLCEIMDEETSIIPTPELVINSAGTRTVHDSFLFTYLSRFSACIVWESTERSKATYIFKVARSTFRYSLQTIFNYIVNDTPNKRSTLSKSPALQRHLGMAAWIPHTTYADWRRQLRPYYSSRE